MILDGQMFPPLVHRKKAVSASNYLPKKSPSDVVVYFPPTISVPVVLEFCCWSLGTEDIVHGGKPYTCRSAVASTLVLIKFLILMYLEMV